MSSKILLVANNPDGQDLAREMAPAGFDLVVAAPDSPEYRAALGEAEYLLGFVAGSVREGLYEAAPKLKLVQMLSAGYDPADLEAARRSGVPLCNNGGANAIAVSEHAILLMLAVSRRVIWQHGNVAAGRWRGNTAPDLHEVHGKTLGVVGLGLIGKRTARLAQAFGMRVIYYDIARLSEDVAEGLGVRFRLLRELLAESDIVSLHMPLNDSTRHLIGAAELARMKASAILVNTSRGPLIDEVALTKALADGTIAGAGLDVFDQEPPPSDNPLFKLDNVVLTAHLAGPTEESTSARLRNAFDNVQRVARGQPALWLVPELR